MGRGRKVALVVSLVLLVIVAWSLVEARLVFVDQSVVASPDLPAELDGTRITFVSDVHAGSLLGRAQMQRTLDDVQALDSDIIIFGGDFGGGGRNGYEWFYPAAAKLEAPLGVYAVLGNHEGGGGRGRAVDDLRRAGITLLLNDNLRIRDGGVGLRLAGLDDYLTGTTDIEAAAEDVSRSEFAILVSHNPDALPQALPHVVGAFDLALSGHNHGGQVTLFGLYAPVLPSRYGQRFRGGWQQVDGVPLLVSRGAGVYILPMRFFAPAQIHSITLRRGRAGVQP